MPVDMSVVPNYPDPWPDQSIIWHQRFSLVLKARQARVIHMFPVSFYWSDRFWTTLLRWSWPTTFDKSHTSSKCGMEKNPPYSFTRFCRMSTFRWSATSTLCTFDGEFSTLHSGPLGTLHANHSVHQQSNLILKSSWQDLVYMNQ